MTNYEDLIKRFAKLPLMARFHIAEELGTQLQPGGSPERSAKLMIDKFIDGLDLYRRFGELVVEAEKSE